MVGKKEKKKIGLVVEPKDIDDVLRMISRGKSIQSRLFRALHLPSRLRRKKRQDNNRSE